MPAFPPSRAILLPTWLLLAATVACEPPASKPAATEPLQKQSVASSAPTPVAAYALDTVRIRRETGLLTMQVAYPRLRPRPGTPAADTAGVGAFNRAAKDFAADLVKEIEATARENQPDQLSTGLELSFRGYLLGQGVASVGFTVTQDGIGPRPITWATGLTYDLRTGRRLQPADLFEQNAAFQAAVLNALQPRLTGEECALETDNLGWDNFALGSDAYYLLLGDAQVGRGCPEREAKVPLQQLRQFQRPGSVVQRL